MRLIVYGGVVGAFRAPLHHADPSRPVKSD